MPKYLSKYDKIELITNKISERIDFLTKRVDYLDNRDDDRMEEGLKAKVDAIDRDIVIHTEEHHEHFKRNLELKRRVEKLEGLKDNDKSDFIKTMETLDESMTDVQRTHLLEILKSFEAYREYIPTIFNKK